MTASYTPDTERYTNTAFRRCGQSGLKLPAISLGLWHNFGGVDDFENSCTLIHTAFDHGITHFDLANNYGPPPGSAEETFGRILKRDLAAYRDELIISSKAGYLMWPGPYGDGGSRKYLLASLDQSLKRMGLDYVDIFYSHRLDPNTPLDETMDALAQAVRTGKALYVGVSNYPPEQTRQAALLLKERGVPLLIHQPRYSILQRDIEINGLLETLSVLGVGCICYSPLAQGLLSDKYLLDIPVNSRAAKPHGFLKKESITPQHIQKLNTLNNLATKRGQTLAQMALAWVLRQSAVTSVLIGASRIEQLRDNLAALNNLTFSETEVESIASVRD